MSLQLNMGEGKSSVIVPLIASTLANGSNLVRIVTPRALSNQMFQLLASRLSGLAHRPIFYVPISRRLSMEYLGPFIHTIRDLYEDCVAKGGVLVVHPDHILSLKLMHIDILLRPPRNSEDVSITGDRRQDPHQQAYELNRLQDWLAKVSRDVLDESDEILHPRYQLVVRSPYIGRAEQRRPDHDSTQLQICTLPHRLIVNPFLHSYLLA